jgi:hypothetical protein
MSKARIRRTRAGTAETGEAAAKERSNHPSEGKRRRGRGNCGPRGEQPGPRHQRVPAETEPNCTSARGYKTAGGTRREGQPPPLRLYTTSPAYADRNETMRLDMEKLAQRIVGSARRVGQPQRPASTTRALRYSEGYGAATNKRMVWPAHVASGSLSGRPRRRVHWGEYYGRASATYYVSSCTMDELYRNRPKYNKIPGRATFNEH